MKRIPYSWQLKAAAIGAAREFISFVASCGCGKTLAAILLAVRKQMPTIIVAPTHDLCADWRDALKEELGEDADVWVYSRPEEVKEGEEKYRQRFEEWLAN